MRILHDDSFNNMINNSFLSWGIYYDELTSTNDVAYELIQSTQYGGTGLVLANYQTQGKGRGTNTWQSSNEKNILMSLVLTPTASEESWSRVTFPVSLAIKQALIDYVPNTVPIHLKWPNDIYIDFKKCVGILPIISQCRQRLIIGIGINVNENALNDDRTSLAHINNGLIDRFELLADILTQINHNLSDVLACHCSAESWHKSALFLNETIEITSGSHLHTGIFKGITDLGYLKLLTNSGQTLIKNGHGFRLLK
jgi:BirA family biotin operon repressor/biotin-[acetyl-CoA-carboxylase] ligase